MPQTVELVRVKTTLGDRIYPQSARVYSNLGGKNLFFHENVSDLNAGEMILWQNQSIDTTLEQIEPYLKQSQRYQRAENAVYQTNSSGHKIPRFRIELIRALADKGVVAVETKEDLEQKVMREQDKDFTPKEYTAMAQFVYSEMQKMAKEDGAPTREQETIRDWLQGTTAGPRDSRVFYSLALATGSKAFEQWLDGAKDSATSSSGFWGAYKFYTTLRQTIMRYLARSKGELKGKTSDNSSTGTEAQNGHKRESLDMTPEIQIVLHQFMEEINEEFSLARIVGVERVTAEAKKQHQQEAEPSLHLAKGAYTGEALPDMRRIPLKQIIDGFNFFGHLSTYIFEEYFSGVSTGKYRGPEKLKQDLQTAKQSMAQLENYIVNRTFVEAVLMAVAQNLGLKKKAEFDYLNVEGMLLRFKDTKTGEDILVKHRNAIAEVMAEQILTGGIDAALGVAQLSTYNSLERWARFFDAIPQVYWEFSTADHAIHMPTKDRQETREVQLHRRKTEKKLHEKYGFDSLDRHGLLVPELLTEVWNKTITNINRHSGLRASATAANEALLRYISESKSQYARMHDSTYLRTNPSTASLATKWKGKVLTRSECAEILAMHGLSELMRFLPEANFMFDDETTGLVNGTQQSVATAKGMS